MGAFLNCFNTPGFATLQSKLPVRNVRFFVPWDTFATASGSTCTHDTSASYTATQVANQDTLAWSIIAAASRHLNVTLVLSGGGLGVSGDTGQPSDSQYECAFTYLVDTIRTTWNASATAHEYETFNEPDEANICASDAAKYYIDALIGDEYGGASQDDIIAGGFGERAMRHGAACGSGDYLPNYMSYLTSDWAVNCNAGTAPCIWPEAISGHPYDDPDQSHTSGSSTPEASYLVDQVNASGFVGDPVFLTESAVWLTDNLPADCHAGSGYADLDSVDDGSYAACVDDSPIAQANAAERWLSLASLPQVFRVYWYQYQAYFNWDSGLLAPSGEARPSYCVLTGQGSASWCAANVNDTSQGVPYDQDYNDNPGGTEH